VESEARIDSPIQVRNFHSRSDDLNLQKWWSQCEYASCFLRIMKDLIYIKELPQLKVKRFNSLV
jgi:hypothetical protein